MIKSFAYTAKSELEGPFGDHASFMRRSSHFWRWRWPANRGAAFHTTANGITA
ncbi:hypothetical protein UNSWCD_269 [Campylobacter concisus UNSWCD]|uniref:hypothetical protein n=1 Tax=Campylobacter concisus TaxID=199 RepID=UPI00025A6B47|nr:hypothetical protein [Campylobacter concisus]EIF07138.1 hypothetical protein UNSWCD_269 [Campylobacter concisus UNSWCD]